MKYQPRNRRYVNKHIGHRKRNREVSNNHLAVAGRLPRIDRGQLPISIVPYFLRRGQMFLGSTI